jgi:DnaA family protein
LSAAQLPLALALADYARFETFVAGPNEAAVQTVRGVADGAPGLVWLFGADGCGKTHLLQAACRVVTAAGRRAMYVPLASADMQPAVLADLERLDLIALDDVDTVAGDPEWERHLFLLLDDAHVRRSNGLLLAARAPASACRWGLADLRSRAAAALAFRLQPLDDDQQREALLAHASSRGLELDRAAADYLLKRVERDGRELVHWLERLDRASLAEQRKLTIPFIREVLRASRAAE